MKGSEHSGSHVVAQFSPFVFRPGEHGADESGDGFARREDANHIIRQRISLLSRCRLLDYI